jgi:hypothetical protein
MARNSYEAGLSYFPDNPALGARVGGWGDLISLVPIPGSSLIATGVNMATSGGAGGATTDAARQQRVTWTLQQAQQGSPLAAALIVAAPANVGTSEAAMWRAALAQVPDVVLSSADAQYPGGFWPTGQPDFYTDTSGQTHRTIVSQVAGAGRVGLAVGTAVAGGINTVTRNPSTALFGILAFGGLVYLASSSGRRRSR